MTSEFEACLVYRVSSRTNKTTQRKLEDKKKKKKKKPNKNSLARCGDAVIFSVENDRVTGT